MIEFHFVWKEKAFLPLIRRWSDWTSIIFDLIRCRDSEISKEKKRIKWSGWFFKKEVRIRFIAVMFRMSTSSIRLCTENKQRHFMHVQLPGRSKDRWTFIWCSRHQCKKKTSTRKCWDIRLTKKNFSRSLSLFRLSLTLMSHTNSLADGMRDRS